MVSDAPSGEAAVQKPSRRDAGTAAAAVSAEAPKPSAKRPLAGIPILVKDNIATGAEQPTTAGSLALEGAHARADATIVKLLRDAGAVILGKANLMEFANMLAIDMPAGYSSLGGQVKNPYAPRADGRSRHSGGISGGIELGGRSGGRSVRGFDRHLDFRLAAAPRELERPRHPGVDRRADRPCRTRLNKVFDWGAGRYRG